MLEQDWDIVVIDEVHQATKPHQFAAEQQPEVDRWEMADETSTRANHLIDGRLNSGVWEMSVDNSEMGGNHQRRESQQRARLSAD